MIAERAALLRVPFAMLAQLLQLPPGARIDAAMVDLSEDSVLTLRVRDAGFMTHEGHKIPLAVAIVTEYRDDEGRCFKRVMDWQMPGTSDKSMCGLGIKVAFLDGAVVQVSETSFSRCLIAAAHQRAIAGASTHLELTIDEPRTKALNVPMSRARDTTAEARDAVAPRLDGRVKPL